MSEHHINFNFKAPYYTLNILQESTKRVWLVCHGYGQLSKFFLRKFKVLDPLQNFLVFPQGLSKFYLDDHKRVGATWMTREDRDTDIGNQYAYIDQVLKDSVGETLSKYEIYLLGFSQGVSTITRYAVEKKLPFNKLILWAGAIPPELTQKDFEFLNESMKVALLLGTQDQYYTEVQYLSEVERAKHLMGENMSFTLFEGKHDLDQNELLKL